LKKEHDLNKQKNIDRPDVILKQFYDKLTDGMTLMQGLNNNGNVRSGYYWHPTLQEIQGLIHCLRSIIDPKSTQEVQDEPQNSADETDGRNSTAPMVSTGGAGVESVSVDAKLEGLLMDVTSAFIESDGLYWKTWVDRIKSICGLEVTK